MIHQPEDLSREELDFQLSPSRIAKDPWGVLQRHVDETAALDHRAGLRITRDIPYGTGARQRFDLCRPAVGERCPCLVFIHGGFWQEGSKDGSGFAAEAFAGAGWAHAGIGYTLAPDATLAQIVEEIARALTTLHDRSTSLGIDPHRLVIAGHSAGAHLAAAMMSGLGGEAAARAIAGAVLISGVYELAPVAASYVNDLVRMDAQAVAALSPLRHRPLRPIPTQVVIGADESDAFQWQSRTLVSAWKPHLPDLSLTSVPGRDHFEILDELGQPDSPVFRAITRMA